jgi:diguanylate cyclase (GGDEF)-like protein/PAS domain S-box-containing protein
VLVTDDDPAIAGLLERFLRLDGHHVVIARDGAQALKAARLETPDLILLDLHMPVLDGMQVLRRLKAQPTTRDIPVVIISAETDVEPIASALDFGAEDYLTKPFNPTVLGARVRASLARRRLTLYERAYQSQLEQQVVHQTTMVAEHAEARASSDAALQRQSVIISSVFASMSEGVVVADPDGGLLHHNPAAEQILGGRLDALLPGHSSGPGVVFQADQQTPLPAERLPLALACAGRTVEAEEIFMALEQGEGRWLSVGARPLYQEQALIGGVMVLRDITDWKRAELALRASEERYALAARGANDGLWDWDVRTNRVFYSHRWKAMLGYGDEALGDTPAEWLDRVHPDDREQLETKLDAHFCQLISHFQHEYRILARDGNYRWMLARGVAVWDEHGRATRFAGSQTDSTDRKQAEQRLLHQALHDGLTGLPNRMLFLDRLRHAMARNQRDKSRCFAVMFLDLDRFKVINDSLGHGAGDKLLETTARRIEGCVRPGDTVARLGGDEFTILVEDVDDLAVVHGISERVHAAVAEPLHLNDQVIFTTASIGYTVYNPGYESAGELIRDADTAMYHAKLAGKARTVQFDPAMHSAAMERLQIESALRWAVERHELQLHYQPIIDLESGRTEGFEALLRWRHPERGLLYPADFIAVAEDTGLIVPLGWWALREACRQLVEWWSSIPGTQALWVSVNMSARQLAQPNVAEMVLAILEETGLPPTALKIEITETTLIENSARVSELLGTLRTAGIKICMDDFGTGYSSLSYIQRLPIDVLKIDRSFVQSLQHGGERSEITQTIIALAHALGLQAVAEGTETRAQADRLQDLQCRYAQGWLFSKPVAAEQIAVLLRDTPLSV